MIRQYLKQLFESQIMKTTIFNIKTKYSVNTILNFRNNIYKFRHNDGLFQMTESWNLLKAASRNFTLTEDWRHHWYIRGIIVPYKFQKKNMFDIISNISSNHTETFVIGCSKWSRFSTSVDSKLKDFCNTFLKYWRLKFEGLNERINRNWTAW